MVVLLDEDEDACRRCLCLPWRLLRRRLLFRWLRSSPLESSLLESDDSPSEGSDEHSEDSELDELDSESEGDSDGSLGFRDQPMFLSAAPR